MNPQQLIMCILRNEYDKALHQCNASEAAMIAATEKYEKHKEHFRRVEKAYEFAVSAVLGEKE